MRSVWYFIIGTILFCVDRITKFWAVNVCLSPCIVNQFLSLQVGYNRGVTWGFLHSHNPLAFVLVTTVISMVTVGVASYAYQQYKQGDLIIGETLVITGSLSNIVDRLWYGGVVDFIEVSYGEWVWPSFNIADAGIVVGVFIMLIMHHKKGA